jgi:hypothetical protein
MKHPFPRIRKAAAIAAVGAVAAVALVGTGSASAAACPFCGRNLIANPGAEAGRGVTAFNTSGAVPHWVSTQGQFGAASWASFPAGWFSERSTGPKDRGKNYFFGGATATSAGVKATIGTQEIKLPAASVHHKATLSGWLGNYGSNMAQVRAQFTDASGKTLAALRIGPDTTIASGNMAPRSRSGTVPAGTATVVVVVTFTNPNSNYNLAGADDLSLVLA